jgi:hypothetical protein
MTPNPPESAAKTPALPARKFKGVWICAALWLNPGLTWLQKCVAAEIDSLADESEPCIAGDEYLAKMFDVAPRRMANIISELCTAGVVERMRKAGHKRGLRLSHGFRENGPACTETVQKSLTESVQPPYKGVPSTEESTEKVKPTETVRELTDAWCVAYERAFLRKYHFAGIKDSQAAKRLLDTGLSVLELLEVAKAAWAAQEERGKFWSKHAASLAGFSARFNDIRNELQPASAKAKHDGNAWSLEQFQAGIYGGDTGKEQSKANG